MAERVRITDVSPRDGLQNEPGVIPTAEKVRLVELLCGTGVDEVEVTSFVSPKWVPQLGDAAEVLEGIRHGLPATGNPLFSAIVPNLKGLEAAEPFLRVPAFLPKLAVITAASETFSQRNTNATIAESLERIRQVVHVAGNGVRVRGYISCAIACPFEGPIDPRRVADVACQLVEIGVDEIDLGDTIGAGTKRNIWDLLDEIGTSLGVEWWKVEKMTLHLHDTFGRAAECVRTALEMGVRSFDGSVAGLGGCPYASTPGQRAPGNISTELLVRTIEDAGYTTGVDQAKLAEAARFAAGIVAKARAGGTP